MAMHRRKLLDQAYRRGKQLTVKNPNYLSWVKRYTIDVMEQDVGRAGDITTQSIFGKEARRAARAIIQAKEWGVVAGIEEVMWFYGQCGIAVKPLKQDGDVVRVGDVILELTGAEQDLLKAERTGLKVLQRMSGIATATRKLQDKVRRAGYDMMVVATRKTHWQLLDKKAVSVGGGGTHRLGLWEAILIKNNHLAGLKKMGYSDHIEQALERVWKWKEMAAFIEIEVANAEDAVRAAKKFKQLQGRVSEKPCIIMLDNVPPPKIRKIIAQLKAQNLWEHVLIEASGRIDETNIIEYAKAGVDAASLGSLTHSPRALDMSQKIVG
jgi:nicotinate-nucleotide pyrophosphorylase (carboxylating)